MQLSFAIDAEAQDTRTRAADVGRERQVSHEALRDAVDEIRRRFGARRWARRANSKTTA